MRRPRCSTRSWARRPCRRTSPPGCSVRRRGIPSTSKSSSAPSSRPAPWSASTAGYRFDHDVSVEIPPTVEKLLLARIDRLTPACHDVLTSASALGRTFGLPLLAGVLEPSPQEALHALLRPERVRERRR